MALDVKIIQIIDEFQYLNEYFYRDEACTVKHELAVFYQKTASSRVSPQIITGSYIGWLTRIAPAGASSQSREARFTMVPIGP